MGVGQHQQSRIKKPRFFNLGLSLVCFTLSSCSFNTNYTQNTVLESAEAQNFKQEIIPSSTFKLTTFHGPLIKGQPLHVYIEGDGHSVESRYRLSKNPTPHQPLALELSLLDPRANVIYLARPCQYTPHALDAYCEAKYWSTHRYSEAVIQANIDVIQLLMQRTQAPAIELVGFSGGGGVAALLAERLPRVRKLTTIAGDLHSALMSEHHRTTPLFGSLDPIESATKISQIPQYHFVGGKDRIVPPKIASSFIARMPNNHCAKIIQVKKAGHHQQWAEFWPKMIEQPYPCQTDYETL